MIRPQLTAPDAVVLVSKFVETLAATAGATGFLSELEASEAASCQRHGSGRVQVTGDEDDKPSRLSSLEGMTRPKIIKLWRLAG